MARPAPGADRSVAVLELLASHPDERFTLSEVARRCELNKATAHALLSALSERGVLLRHPDEKRYSLGPRLIAIGDAARRGYTAVDFLPAVLDRLAAGTGLWARAWQTAGDNIVCVAQAGVPSGRSPAATVRLPLVPPVGALFMAWSDEPTVEAWLARAPAVDAVQPAFDALPAIRARGFAVTLASREWCALSELWAGGDGSGGAGHTDRSGIAALGPQAQRTLLLAVARQALLVPELDDLRAYRPADIAAPVFGSTGLVELAVSVSGLGDTEMTGADLRALAGRVAAAADDLTAAVCGRHP
jgi:DNA-binding IclR family transcriptional regulator